MKTVIHIPGRLKLSGIEQTVAEYQKRITDWSLEIESGYPSLDSNKKSLVALDKDGQMITTEGLCDWLAKKSRQVSSIHLLIGGKEGLDEKLIKASDWSWSLGPLVFNQSLAAAVVAEQLYRCYALRTGHPYH
ncbi:MAG: 23S rRNA (pseudouridine(1915)-N(3))-methyltransferase RlmH [bacterium]